MSVQLSLIQPQVQANNHSAAEVLEQVEIIVNWSCRVGSPMGYYAQWLGRLIEHIDAERSWDRFAYPDAIHQLNLRLANRYFDALNLFHEGEGEAPLCWQAAFMATHQTELTVFQHLVMGTNALVQHDLPLALSTLLVGQPDTYLRQDLVTLLDLIETNLRHTQQRFAQQSRVFRMMDAFGRSHNHWFEIMDLPGRPEPTYQMAQQLAAQRGKPYQDMAQVVDQGATEASRVIIASAHRVLRRWFAQVSRWENQPVADIMAWLKMSEQ